MANAARRVIVGDQRVLRQSLRGEYPKGQDVQPSVQNLERGMRVGKPPQSLGWHVFDYFVSVPATAAAQGCG